jgi:signal transduction histidine kinase
MKDLMDELWRLDAESDWASEDIQNPQGAQMVLKRYLEKILRLLKDYFPKTTHAYVALTGLQSQFFQPAASIGRPLEDITPTSTRIGGSLLTDTLNKDGQITVFLINDPAKDPRFTGDPEIREKVLIRIKSSGEFVGFISLDSRETPVFTQERITQIRRAEPVLSRTIGDAIFTMRLRQLASPFEFVVNHDEKHGLLTLYKQITDRTLLGFAADCAILRIYDATADRLMPEAFSGEISDRLLDENSAGERACRAVFQSEDYSWTIGMDDENPVFSGEPIPEADEKELVQLGMHSYIIIRLASDGHESDKNSQIGTLAFFHLRPNRYTWRDLALARSFCQQAADTVALYQQTTELYRKTDQLEDSLDSLRLQNQRLTQMEVVALLTHDLGHKAFEACRNVDDYIRRCKKALNSKRESRSHQHLDEYADQAMTSTLQMQDSMNKIRLITGREYTELGEATEFRLDEVFEDVERTMAGALQRNNITIVKNLPQIRIKGYKTVLGQAFFNLVINSIEAIRRLRDKTNRPLNIHVRAREESRGNHKYVIIHFWDDGPGIDRTHFPNPMEIFELGKTSKEQGTGTGLPVSQRLLERFYNNADLTLEDAGSARFRISIPVKG